MNKREAKPRRGKRRFSPVHFLQMKRKKTYALHSNCHLDLTFERNEKRRIARPFDLVKKTKV